MSPSSSSSSCEAGLLPSAGEEDKDTDVDYEVYFQNRKEHWTALLSYFLQHFALPVEDDSADYVRLTTDIKTASVQKRREITVCFILTLLKAQPILDWEALKMLNTLILDFLTSATTSNSAGNDSVGEILLSPSHILYAEPDFLSHIHYHIQHCLQYLHDVKAMECLALICDAISYVAKEGMEQILANTDDQQRLDATTFAQSKLQGLDCVLADKMIEILYRTYHFILKHVQHRALGENVIVAATLAITNLALHQTRRTIYLYNSHALETFNDILNTFCNNHSNSSNPVADTTSTSPNTNTMHFAEGTLIAMFGAIRNICNAYVLQPPTSRKPSLVSADSTSSSSSLAASPLTPGSNYHVARSSSFSGQIRTFSNQEILQHFKQIVYTLSILLQEYQTSAEMVKEVSHTIMFIADHVMMTHYQTATLRSNQNNFLYIECADLMIELLRKYSKSTEVLGMLLCLVELLHVHSAPPLPDPSSEPTYTTISLSTRDVLDALGMFLLGHGIIVLAQQLQDYKQNQSLVETLCKAFYTIFTTYERQYGLLPRTSMAFIDWNIYVYPKVVQDAFVIVKKEWKDKNASLIEEMFVKIDNSVKNVQIALFGEDHSTIEPTQQHVVEVSTAHTDCCCLM